MADLPLSLSFLGPTEVAREGAPVRLGSPQQRRLLAVLAVHANDVVSSDRLVDVLWGEEPPPSAAHTLQALVSRLRDNVGSDPIETVAPGYRLRIERDALDALRFDDLVREGLASLDRPREAVAVFEAALRLWRGQPYMEFADDEFASAEAARLAELRSCAVEEHASALVELGRAGEVIAELEAEIEGQPFRERLRAVQMTALARAGRPVESLRAFDAYRRVLADEVGVTPSPELQALNDDILRQHPDLGWERPSTSSVVEGLPTGTVTFLFTDLEGSTRLWEEHADAMAGALARHNEIVRAAVETNGGIVVKTTGDGFHAAFANASDALDAAVVAQRALQEEPWPETVPLRARMGVHTGEANRRDGDYYGPALNHAARLMGIAHGGQIVCSGIVAHLAGGGDGYELEDLGQHRLRDVESALQVFQVNAPGLESRFAPLASQDAYRSNLPRELSGFVGRTDDVMAVTKALAEARVVSLVGVGGAGKTRLASRVGSDALSEYADGVWWCELAGVRDPDAVPEAVAAALGYAPSQGASVVDGLAAFFRHKQLLLVLDNCEHLLPAVGAFVRTLSEAAPRLSVLTTSREALAIAGERTYPLPPLELPLDTSPFAVESSEAGQLFVARARDVRGSFAVTEENSAAIAELCAHLDGNALAIELAAARTALMTPTEIVARLGERFRLLKRRGGDTAERHQTLHAAIDWSYALLDTGERTLLQWLSVPVGDFDLAAATAIGAGAGLDEFDAVERLGSLVAKSLVERTEADGVSRYRLLETIRQYAAERLATEGDTDQARDVHAAHYVAVGSALFAQFRTPLDFEALEQLRIETPNLATGLRRLIESGQVEDVLGFFDEVGFMDSGLVPFVLMDELGRVADEALASHGTGNAPGYVATLAFSGLRAFQLGDRERYLYVVAAAHAADPDSVLMVGAAIGAAAIGGDLAGGIAIGRAGIERARTAGDPRLLSYLLSLVSLGETMVDPAAALAHVEEGVEVARSLPAPSALVYPLCQLSVVLRAEGSDPDRALAAAEECIRLDRSHRKVWSAISESTAAMLRINRGELASGLRLWSDVLHRFDWAGEVGYLSLQLAGAAEVLADVDPCFALDLAAIADCGVVSTVPVLDMQYEWFIRLASELGADAIEAARARAGSMSYDDVVTYIFDNVERLIAEADREPGSRP